MFSASGTNAGTTDYKEELNKIREQVGTISRLSQLDGDPPFD